MGERRTRHATAIIGLLALASSLAPAPQAPTDPARDPRAISREKAAICRRMVDYYRESIKAPPRNVDPLGPAGRYAADYEPIELWSRRLADAGLEAAADAGERAAILQGEVDRIGKFSGEIAEMGRDSPEWKVVADRVGYYRLDAEYRLAREKAGK